MARLLNKLSYANVMATLAFFFALSGASMAGVKYVTASDEIPVTSDLAGSTYGNPQIAAGKVTSGKIADGAITSSKFDSSALAPNADKLDGLDSSAFATAGSSYTKGESDGRYLGITATAADSDKLDGNDSTAFLGVDAKAADADKLDGFDSTAFVRGTIAIVTKQVSIGGGGFVSSFASCGNGKALGGGAGFLEHVSFQDQITHSHPNASGTSWQAGIVNGTTDTQTAVIYAICLS